MRTQRWMVDGLQAWALLRPDGQWFLRLPQDPTSWSAALAERPAGVDRLVLIAPEGDSELRLRELGFTPQRTEQLWHVPLDELSSLRLIESPHDLLPVNHCDLARVTDLDNVVRHQIPGAEEWNGTVEELQQSLEDDEFDPQLYLIAVRRETGSYDGLVRVWNRWPRPRVGCLGVTPDWRRTRLATVLLSAVVTTLRDRGVTHVQTETDLHNADSRPLVANHGGIPVGRTIEWTWDSDADPRAPSRSIQAPRLERVVRGIAE